MPVITGDARFTADFLTPSTGGFPATSGQRYPLGLQCLFRRSGTDPDQVDAIHALRYTFVASTAQEINLLTLVGPRVRLFMVKFVDGANAAAWLKFGGAASDEWAEMTGLTIRPGTTSNHGGLAIPAPGTGMPVTSVSKMLKMLPSAHAFSVDLLILGTSV